MRSGGAGTDDHSSREVSHAAAQEAMLPVLFAVAEAGMGPFLYRFAPPDQL